MKSINAIFPVTIAKTAGAAVLALTIAVSCPGQSQYATPYAFTTLAGMVSVGSADGPADVARFYAPQGVAIDALGNIYVTDTGNHTIRRIARDGSVVTIGGAPGVPGSTDGAGAVTRFRAPQGVAVDSSGSVYVADSANHCIRRIAPSGAVTILAGRAGVAGSDDGNGSAATFNYPAGLAIDRSDNLYASDQGNHTVRRITSSGTVTTLAGTPGATGDADGVGPAAIFYRPGAIAVDHDGNVWVNDRSPVVNRGVSDRIRRITPDGVVTTVARYGSSVLSDSPVRALAFDADGNRIESKGNQLRRVLPGGVVQIIAGGDAYGFHDGPATEARFAGPGGVTFDVQGSMYVADTENNVIRQVNPAGSVSTVAGFPETLARQYTDGTGSGARFDDARKFAMGPTGDLYVTEYLANVVRKISPAGVVTTLAMPGVSLQGPTGVAVDPAGNIFVIEFWDNILRINPDGVVQKFAALPGMGRDLAIDQSGNLYVAGYEAIWKVTGQGVVSTLTNGITDFGWIEGIAVDRIGNVYAADGAGMIWKILPSGEATILAGASNMPGDADGPGRDARFASPRDVAVDAAGNVFVADISNQTIRKIAIDGMVTTIAGRTAAPGGADGVGDGVRFYYPWAIAIDAIGTLHVLDVTSIRRGTVATAPMIVTQPASRSALSGSSVRFSVVAGGNPAPTRQWFLDGRSLLGKTGDVLDVVAGSGTAGDYTVVLTNPLGTLTSAPATLTVTASTPPNPTPAPAPAGGGGGGAIEPSFLLALGAMFVVRLLVNRKTARSESPT